MMRIITIVSLLIVLAVTGCRGPKANMGTTAKPAVREIAMPLEPIDFQIEKDTSIIEVTPPAGYRTQITNARAITTIQGTHMSVIVAGPQGNTNIRRVPMVLNQKDGVFESALDTNWVLPAAHKAILEIYDPVAGTPTQGKLMIKGRHLPK